jgi:hypothetical protein
VARQIDRDNLDELIQAAKGARGARPALGLLPSSTVELVAQCLDLFVISSPVTGPWSALRDRPSRDGARWAGSTNSE